MKSIYKIFLLALGVYTSAFSQITEITRLPVQDISQSIKESAPVWLSENEIMIFYVERSSEASVRIDTIFSTLSMNRGVTWYEPEIVQVVERPSQSQLELHLTSLMISTGRILLAWSVFGVGMKVIYSEDKGENWSQPTTVLGKSGVLQTYSTLMNLNQLENDKIVLSFSPPNTNKSYFRNSSDNGETWTQGEPFDFSAITGSDAIELSFISIGEDSLLALFQLHYQGIYSRFSYDGGLTWTDTVRVSDDNSNINETRPRITKLIDGVLRLVYQTEMLTGIDVYTQNDIYHRSSFDKGLTWTAGERFTKYVGEDLFININSYGEKTFLSFATERFSSANHYKTIFKIAYAILEETIEQFTPPKVYNSYAPQELIDYDKKEFVYRATVIDDEAVESVSAVMEDSIYIGEMFDDGMHSDEEANDAVFANLFPFVNPRYLNGYYLDVNKIELPLNNAGILADANVTYNQQATVITTDFANNKSTYKNEIYLGGGGSMGKYDGGGFLFSAGFFLSGYVNENLFVNGVASSCLVEVYQPGIVGSDPDDLVNTLYVVNKNDPPFGISWQNWKTAVLLGAEFYDGDDDGIYNPNDKNFSGTWELNEDMPPLIGDEIVWCVYNDGMPAIERRFGFKLNPVGIEVRQTLFASNNPELENVIFIKYNLTNTGLVSDVLDSVFFSPWDDTDIGDATDDLSGCDTLLNSIFTYNASVDAVYGNNPPAVYTSILQGPIIDSGNISDTAYIRNGELLGEQIFAGYKNLGLFSFAGYAKSDPDQGDPRDSAQVWNYVFAQDRYGNLLNPCDTGYGKVYGGVDCNKVNPMYWFSGDPVSQIGWLDISARDDRKFSSIGPLKLEKDNPQDIIIAYVIGRGSDPLNSVTVARENVQRAIQEYESNFASMTYTPPAPTNPVNSYVLYQNYPNPFNPITTIRYELPQDGVVTIDVFDILGQKVKTILNEFKKADRYEVTFNSAGLASGVYIYQLRVNDFITSKKMVLLR
jgi:BNR repeat-like domain/Secretion system C-terminal sorting domain